MARDRNIKLVENAGRKYAGDVRAIFDDPDNYGKRVEDLRDLLYQRGNVSTSRATLIARDQVGKLNGALTRARHEAAGIEKYVWSSSKDERVREAHRELDGRTFSWAEGLPPDVADEASRSRWSASATLQRANSSDCDHAPAKYFRT